MTNLTIVAILKVDPKKVEELTPLFADLIATTRTEKGCIRYDLHHDNDDVSRFMFYETWASRDLWQDHMTAPHLQSFQQAAGDIIISAEIFEMTQLGL